MAPAKSDQNDSNQPAPPHQDRTDQGPTPRVHDAEQDSQPIEQEVSVAIMRPWNTTIPYSEEMRADFEKVFSERQPMPDDDIDDFADEPLSTPFDPETSTPYDWARPEAWVKEKNSEGNDYRRVSLSIINLQQDKQCGAIKLPR